MDTRIESKQIIRMIIKNFIIILTLYIIFNFLIGIGRIINFDMYPALMDGDLVIYNRLSKAYNHGDVITFEKNGKQYYSRVIAIPGDTVDISEEGVLFINGNVQQDESFYPTYKGDKELLPLTIKEGEVFVLGDFRTGAFDSREFGVVFNKEMKGKAISILRVREL